MQPVAVVAVAAVAADPSQYSEKPAHVAGFFIWRILTLLLQIACMQSTPTREYADGWIDQLFSAKAARTGGVIRRSVHWMHREVGLDRIKEEVHLRGFHMIECGNQYVIICNKAGLQIIC